MLIAILEPFLFYLMKGENMKGSIEWNSGLSFTGTAGNNSVAIDTKPPMGSDNGASPKEIVAMAIAGCSGMDVISLFKKYKQLPKSFKVDVDVEQTAQGVYPVIFKSVQMNFLIEGEVDESKAIEAVKLSMTEYCGVAAMISKSCPITYTVTLNGKQIDQGEAKFK